ncbi:unnamed protein product, partial [marine sediment metagenome]
LKAETHMFASIVDTYGNLLTDEIDLQSGEFLITWDDLSGTFTIGGSVVA